MSQINTIVAQIAANATAPRSASNDGGSASQHSLPDQIAAARFAAAAAITRGTGIRYVQQRPPSNADIRPYDDCDRHCY